MCIERLNAWTLNAQMCGRWTLERMGVGPSNAWALDPQTHGRRTPELVLLQLKLAVLKYRHYKLNKIAKTMKLFEQLENLKSRWVSYWH